MTALREGANSTIIQFCQSLPIVVLVWLGSCTVCVPLRCSGVNRLVNLSVCLFLSGVCKVTEPLDTSTANVYPTPPGKLQKNSDLNVRNF